MEKGKKLLGIMGDSGEFNQNLKGLFEYLRKTEKRIEYTFGLAYRHPTTFHKPITAKEAIEALEDYTTEVDEFDNYIHVNSYSANDLW